MTQIERIQYMENILCESIEAVASFHTSPERYFSLKPRIAELEAYYTSPQWLRDYEDDCAGKFPQFLRRGVLSEDAVYNLLQVLSELENA